MNCAVCWKLLCTMNYAACWKLVYNELCCPLETVVNNELCCQLGQVPTVNWAFRQTCLLETTVYNQLGFYFGDRCIQWTGLSFWRPRYKELGYFGDCCLQRTGLFVGDKYSRWTVLSVGDQMICAVALQSSGAVWKSRWTSWAPDPNKPTVSVDVKQHFNNKAVAWRVTPWAVAGGHPMDTKITR